MKKITAKEKKLRFITLYISKTFSRYRIRNITDNHMVSAANKQDITCHIVEFLNEEV